MGQFQDALKKLVEDRKYRDEVAVDPSRLTKDYKLETPEILLLLQVWHATGDPQALGSWWLCHCCCGFTSKPTTK
jgi:hypothetical protein